MRLAALPLAFLLLAGCLGASVDAPADDDAAGRAGVPGAGLKLDALSKPTLGMLPKTVEYVTASIDEILLHTEVYLPEGEGPWPTILVMSPYHNLDRTTDPIAGELEVGSREYYVPRGYAVVLTDVRGTGNSEGCMDMMGAKEQQDGYDVVEWIAAQPWSSGKVGMYGVSYVGTTPGAAAIMAPPHLTTIVPVAGVTNQWRNMYQNGVPYNGRSYPLTYEALVGAPPPRDVERGPAWLLNAAAAGCDQEEMIEHVSPGTYEKGVYDDYWAERNFTTRASNVRASVFYVQGFTDRAVNPMEAVHWFNDIQAPKKAWLGQWPHQTPPRDDWEDTRLAWFDFWLKGIDTGIMDTPTVEVITNDDRIRVDSDWPPRNATALALHLAPGELASAAPDDGSESYEYNAGAFAATETGVTLAPSPPAGVAEGLTFTGAELAGDVYLAGNAVMHLVGSVDAPNTYWLFELWDVGGGEDVFVSEGWMNAHLHEGFDHSAPLTPGEKYAFTFKFEPREYVFAGGHRIELRLLATDDAVFPFDEPRTTNTVHYGAEGSWLELPVLDRPVLHERPDGV